MNTTKEDVELLVLLRSEIEESRARLAVVVLQAVELGGQRAHELPEKMVQGYLAPSPAVDKIFDHARTHAILVRKYNEVFSRVAASK